MIQNMLKYLNNQQITYIKKNEGFVLILCFRSDIVIARSDIVINSSALETENE